MNNQPYPLFIGEPKTLSIKFILEHPVFFDQIVDDRQLVPVKPTGQSDGQKLEGTYDVRHCYKRLSVILFYNNIIRLARVFAPYGLNFRWRIPTVLSI